MIDTKPWLAENFSWRQMDASITDASGNQTFHMADVEVPHQWRDSDIAIIASKYLHPQDNKSIRFMISRVVDTIAQAGLERGYFEDESQATIFAQELAFIVYQQEAAWNSPVWFNVGIEEHPQCWACLILSVDDDMHGEHGILQWIQNEALCFLGGSGVGVNISRIRGDGEPLRNGKGVASGPVSFMRWADAGAGSIKSGGRTRRAAKMVILDADHPDVEEYIDAKAKAERMMRTLKADGFDITLNGPDSQFISFQNANHSVRVTNDFMRTISNPALDDTWKLNPRLGMTEPKEVSARRLWGKMARAAWECADPGVQFHDTINSWHTTPNLEPIRASNPCSEYMHVDDTVCNLSSLNLVKFWDTDLRNFNVIRLAFVTQMMITSMDILVDLSSYPTQHIANKTRSLRNLGIGFTNLGALLMYMGLGYGSESARRTAAGLMYLIQAQAAYTSSVLAEKLGPYEHWYANENEHKAVLRRHWTEPHRTWATDESPTSILWEYGSELWSKALIGQQRNAQLSVIAPTGTISFLMGAETTGIEPVFALQATKELVGGGTTEVSPYECVNYAVRTYFPNVTDLDRLFASNPVFATAVGPNALKPIEHLWMMSAVQPSVSGAISKTVNVPSDITSGEVGDLYLDAWRLGLKALAIYRDASKAFQPLTVGTGTEVTVPAAAASMSRRRLSSTARSVRHKFTIDGQDFYLHAGFYDDGQLGEIFLRGAQEGSFVSGMMDSFATAVSLALQYGVPLTALRDKFVHRNFEPNGVVLSDSNIKMARSVVDYVFRWLTVDERLGIDAPITLPPIVSDTSADVPTARTLVEAGDTSSGAPCPECHALALRWAGSCRRCTNCGYDEGCG